MKKVLFLRFSSIGDIVLCSAATRCFKNTYPKAEIHFATKPAFADLALALPGVDKVKILKQPISEFNTELQEERYDFIIDLHHNLRTFLIKAGLRVRSTSFHKENFNKWMMVNLKSSKTLSHVSFRYLDCMRELKVEYDGLGLGLKEELLKLPTEIQIPNHPFLAVALGAKFATKQIPISKLELILKSFTYPVVLLGGKEDEDLGSKLESTHPASVTNLAGKCSILESAAVVSASRAVLSGDTGLMHIAAALKVKSFSVWGNTVPEFGMYPLYPDSKDNLSTTYEVEGLSCRPCSKIGYSKCPKGHFKCMENNDWAQMIQDLQTHFSD